MSHYALVAIEPKKNIYKFTIITSKNLQPSTDSEHSCSVQEEKENEADTADDKEESRRSHEKRRRLEGGVENLVKLQEVPSARELARVVAGYRSQHTELVESKKARAVTVARVPDPLGLDEGDDVENGVTDREHCPQHAHSARISHVVSVVDFRQFCRVLHLTIHVCGFFWFRSLINQVI